MPRCPDCHTDQVIKNGAIHNGKPKYAYNACGRQFVDDPQFRVISDEITGIIDRLLLDKDTVGRHRSGGPGLRKPAPGIRKRELPSRPTRDTGPIKNTTPARISCYYPGNP